MLAFKVVNNLIKWTNPKQETQLFDFAVKVFQYWLNDFRNYTTNSPRRARPVEVDSKSNHESVLPKMPSLSFSLITLPLAINSVSSILDRCASISEMSETTW